MIRYIYYLQLGCHQVGVHIYTQTIHRKTQITTNVEECWPCPVFASFTLAFALQLRKEHGKTPSQGKVFFDCVSLVSLVLWFPFFKICQILLPADPPTSSPLTLAYSCPSRLFPFPFRCNPSLAQSPSSIQLFGSTKVRPKALATHSNLSLYLLSAGSNLVEHYQIL